MNERESERARKREREREEKRKKKRGDERGGGIRRKKNWAYKREGKNQNAPSSSSSHVPHLAACPSSRGSRERPVSSRVGNRAQDRAK